MPFVSKPNNRQTGTPSPTPVDFLNKLLVVKDDVNGILLNEHTKIAELSNLVSDVEDQIRTHTEQTIRNLKGDFEKRKRKIIPGIKRLQDSLKSLSKSESRCKSADKTCKNADAKKAKRRIKDAQKTLQDYNTYDIGAGTVTVITEQITVLCQLLMQISPKLKSNDSRHNAGDLHKNDKSDTDSDNSSRVNTPTNHVYAEIDVRHSRNSQYLTPRRSTAVFIEESTKKVEDSDRDSLVPRLNSVVLFSSESDDEYGFECIKEKHKQISTKAIELTSEQRSSRPKKKNNTKRSKSPTYEILNRPKITELFRSSLSTRLSPSTREHISREKSPSPIPFDDYEKPVKKEHVSLNALTKGYTRHISPVLKSEHECLHTQHKGSNEPQSSNQKTVPKRLLPATPKYTSEIIESANIHPFQSPQKYQGILHDAADEIDAGYIKDTKDKNTFTENTEDEIRNSEKICDEGTKESNIHFDDISNTDDNYTTKRSIGSIGKAALLDSDYIDIDEIKFRETVRTARREIIDKLKKRYTHKSDTSNADENASIHTDERLDNHYSVEFPIHSYSAAEDFSDSAVLNCSSNSSSSLEQNTGVYKGKLIYTTNDTDSGYQENTNSSISSKIKMFETASVSHDRAPSKATRHKPVVKYQTTVKYRSMSEPRKPVSTLLQKSFGHDTKKKQPNKALQPRFPFDNCDKSEKAETDMKPAESGYWNRSCTENDLLNLVQNESSSSIRKHWMKRRSSSMTPKVPDTHTYPGPLYEYLLSFSIPPQHSQCFISAMAILEDGSIILLDERHSFLHLFDKTYRHRDQYRLLNIPKCCVKVKSDTVAVAFPYNRCICTFNVNSSAILSSNEMSVHCKAWIVDVKCLKGMLYVICKEGDVHILSENGIEKQQIRVGMTGFLCIQPTGKFIYILGQGRISKFNNEGLLISSRSDIDAHSMIYIENRIYVADRQRHKVMPFTEHIDVHNLIDRKIEYPSAMCTSLTGDLLLVSQFEESMDINSTREITVLKLKGE